MFFVADLCVHFFHIFVERVQNASTLYSKETRLQRFDEKGNFLLKSTAQAIKQPK